MTHHGKTLKQDEQRSASQGATRTETAQNHHALLCSGCDETYYVDESTYHQFMRGIEYDPTDNSFLCEGCIEELAEEEHSRM